MTITESPAETKMEQGRSLEKDALEQCPLLEPEAPLSWPPSLGRVCRKTEPGPIVQLFLTFSVPLVCWLALSQVDEWNNRQTSDKTFLCSRTMGPGNKGQEELSRTRSLDKRAFKTLKNRTPGSSKTTARSMPTSCPSVMHISERFTETLQGLNQTPLVFAGAPPLDQVTLSPTLPNFL